MKKYAIVTDSTTYFTEEDFTKYGIKRASLNVLDGDEAYPELEITNDLIYKKFAEGKKLTTSQPSPGEFLTIYEELIEKGIERVFVLVISEKLSGTYQSSKIARNMLDNPELVHIFDSNMAAYGNEMLLLQLMDLINRGLSEEDIISKMDHYIEHAGLLMTSEDLISIIRSGRLSKAKGIIGTVLRIKPVIAMKHGKLELLTSARTKKKALDHIMEHMVSKLKGDFKKLHVRVCSHNSLEFAEKLKEEVKKLYKNAEVTFSEYIGPVFNVHVGPKGFGVSWTTE